jgi:hypothetical protein
MTGAAAIGLNARNRTESAAASLDPPSAQYDTEAHEDHGERE